MGRKNHEQTAKLCQALASPTRLRALNLLAQRAWSMSELATELGESLASTSAHLKTLRTVNLASFEKQGREVICRVDSPEAIAVFVAAQKAAETLIPELREAARQADEDAHLLRGQSFEELADAVSEGRTRLIDFRPEAEFQTGHIPGAESRPFDTLADTTRCDFRGKADIVGYCRGPWCPRAMSSIAYLNDHGVPAKRLRAGIVEWRAAGLPLATGDAPTSN